MSLKLRPKTMKVMVVLDPVALIGVTVPHGQSKFPVTIETGGKALKADLNAKSMRRAVLAVTEAGPDGVSVTLQGKLVGEVIEDAGVVATPKTHKSQGDKPEEVEAILVAAVQPPQPAANPSLAPSVAQPTVQTTALTAEEKHRRITASLGLTGV